MSNKELAEWFKITPKTFSNNRKKKLIELENYADFKIYRGGVEILKIKIEIYNKDLFSLKTKIKNLVRQYWRVNELDTCDRVKDEIKPFIIKDYVISDDTLRIYTGKGRTALYGSPIKQTEGELGWCHLQLCIVSGSGKDRVYRYLTSEEEEIKQDLLKKYFGSTSEKLVLVKDIVKKDIKEMDEKEKSVAYENIENLLALDRNYKAFMDEFFEKAGGVLTRGTQVELFSSTELKQRKGEDINEE